MYKFRHINGSKNDYNFTTQNFNFQDDKMSNLQTVFDSYLAIASNAPFLLVFALSFSKHLKRYVYIDSMGIAKNVTISNSYPNRLNETVKNGVAFICLFLVFVSITSFVLIDTDKYQTTFLRLTLVSVFFLNMVASFIQANFAGLASLLPNQIMHLMVTGQAMSGLFAVSHNSTCHYTYTLLTFFICSKGRGRDFLPRR